MRETFRRAYYIKLGAGGRWAESSIGDDLLRFGWSGIPLQMIYGGEWDAIRAILAKEHSHPGVVTADTERLRDLAESTSDDVWITFHQSRLWWCRLADGPVEEDAISKFRRVQGRWNDHDVGGRRLLANQLPGKIAQLQGFRATVCSVREGAALERLLNGEPSPAYTAVEQAREQLVQEVMGAIRELHWKDFETLVDLVFRHAGWRRLSVLGETMKFADLELQEPITGDLYQVQIKSKADLSEFRNYISAFSRQGFRRLYFVVHSPTLELEMFDPGDEAVELILPLRLARFTVDAGLVDWLMGRVR